MPVGQKPRRILVVEDEFLIALELESRLHDAGFEVVGIASTASDAVRLGASLKPDLAIMDIRLAGQADGINAAIDLFAIFGIRSVFASAHTDMETRERAAPASPIGWLQKPYATDELVGIITAYFHEQGC